MVMGCEIKQLVDGSVRITQESNINAINEGILSTESQCKTPDLPATAAERKSYRSVIGQRLYVGRTSNLLMLFHSSKMSAGLEQHHLKDLLALVKSDKQNVPTILFRSPYESVRFDMADMSDASMSPTSEGGRRGAYILYRRCGDVIHPIFWSARKLRRIARSSMTAELLAASDAFSTLRYLQKLHAELTYRPNAGMFVESR